MVGLRYMCVKAVDGATGLCVIRELAPDMEAIERFVGKLPIDIPWCGEGIPGLTQKVLNALLKSERKYPTVATRAHILEAQQHSCNMCGSTFQGDLEWDHVAPLHSTCQGTEQVFQAVCSACHAEKTALQGEIARSLVSPTSRHVWRNYVETKRPPPLVWSPHAPSEKAKLCELDIIRCRRNALLHCPFDLPVLCPFDNIETAIEGTLADFNYVELTGRGRCSSLGLLPYVGPLWYHRVAVEHLLHFGIAEFRDIKWQLNATGMLPRHTKGAPPDNRGSLGE